MLCPDKSKKIISGDMMKNNRFDREGRGIITIERSNGSITMTVDAYMKLSKSKRDALHKAWEEK